eukprot:scaffold3955_cov160-Cylindrotheca_fusiformis.AAC.8
MRVLMISVGSWGDVEPYVALAHELLKRQHAVDLWVQPEYIPRIPAKDDSSSFQIHALPFRQEDFYKVRKSREDVCDPKLRHVETVGEIMGELVVPCWELIYPIACQCQAVVASALARPLSILLTKSVNDADNNLKMVLLHLQPLAPNRIFPLYRISIQKSVQAIMAIHQNNVVEGTSLQNDNISDTEEAIEESYWKIDQPLEETFLKRRMQEAYQGISSKNTNRPPVEPPTWTELQQILRGNNPQYSIVNAYSTNDFVPPIANTPGVGPHVYDIGPLADNFIPSNFVPNSSLEAFLRDNNKPMCVGFGSMPFRQFTVLMEALMELDEPTLLVGAHFQFRSCPSRFHSFVFDNPKVYRAVYIPYAYVLPKCSMMLCHGGAGVVHACLRAKIPCIVHPIMAGDQFFFASLLEHKNLGVQCCANNHSSNGKAVVLTNEDILRAVQRAKQQKQQQNDVLQKEWHEEEQGHGVVRLATLLETICSNH